APSRAGSAPRVCAATIFHPPSNQLASSAGCFGSGQGWPWEPSWIQLHGPTFLSTQTIALNAIPPPPRRTAANAAAPSPPPAILAQGSDVAARPLSGLPSPSRPAPPP